MKTTKLNAKKGEEKMKKGMMTQPSKSAPPSPAQSPIPASAKHPRIGLIVTMIGVLVIFLAAIVYLVIGQAAVGIVGIFFVIVIAYFLRRGQNANDVRINNSQV